MYIDPNSVYAQHMMQLQMAAQMQTMQSGAFQYPQQDMRWQHDSSQAIRGYAGSAASAITLGAPAAVTGVGALALSLRYGLDPFTMAYRGWGAGAAASGTAIGGLSGALTGAAAIAAPMYLGAKAIDYAGSQMFTGAKQQAHINEMLQANFRFSNPLSSSGTGFSREDMSGIAGAIRSLSGISELMTSVEELTQIVPKLKRSGMLQTQNVNEFKRVFTDSIKALREIADVTGTTLSGAADIMGNARRMGFYSARDVMGNTFMQQGIADITGMSRSGVEALQYQGADIAQQYGARRASGARASMRYVGALSVMQQEGLLDPALLSELSGGRSGSDALQAVSGQLTQAAYRFTRTSHGKALAAALGAVDAQGRYTGEIDRDLAEQFSSGGMRMGDIMSLAQRKTASQGGALTFTAMRNRIGGGIAQRYGMEVMTNLLGGTGFSNDERSFIVQRMSGGNADMAQLLQGLAENAPSLQESVRSRVMETLERGTAATMREERSFGGAKRRLSKSIDRLLQGPELRRVGANLQNQLEEVGESIEDWWLGRTRAYVSQYASNELGRELSSGVRRGLNDLPPPRPRSSGDIFRDSLSNFTELGLSRGVAGFAWDIGVHAIPAMWDEGRYRSDAAEYFGSLGIRDGRISPTVSMEKYASSVVADYGMFSKMTRAADKYGLVGSIQDIQKAVQSTRRHDSAASLNVMYGQQSVAAMRKGLETELSRLTSDQRMSLSRADASERTALLRSYGVGDSLTKRFENDQAAQAGTMNTLIRGMTEYAAFAGESSSRFGLQRAGSLKEAERLRNEALDDAGLDPTSVTALLRSSSPGVSNAVGEYMRAGGGKDAEERLTSVLGRRDVSDTEKAAITELITRSRGGSAKGKRKMQEAEHWEVEVGRVSGAENLSLRAKAMEQALGTKGTEGLSDKTIKAFRELTEAMQSGEMNLTDFSEGLDNLIASVGEDAGGAENVRSSLMAKLGLGGYSAYVKSTETKLSKFRESLGKGGDKETLLRGLSEGLRESVREALSDGRGLSDEELKGIARTSGKSGLLGKPGAREVYGSGEEMQIRILEKFQQFEKTTTESIVSLSNMMTQNQGTITGGVKGLVQDFKNLADIFKGEKE